MVSISFLTSSRVTFCRGLVWLLIFFCNFYDVLYFQIAKLTDGTFTKNIVTTNFAITNFCLHLVCLIG